MKKTSLLALFFIFFFGLKSKAQVDQYQHVADSLFQHLDKSGVSTGVLYDRVFPISALNNFNLVSPDTSSMAHFIQAYSEYYRASYSPSSSWLTVKQLQDATTLAKIQNKVQIGLGNYQFNTIDTNAIESGLIRLELSDSLYYDVAGRPRHPYNILNSFVAAALADSVEIGTVEYVFGPGFVFNYGTKVISILSIDFDNGAGLQAVSLSGNKLVYYDSPGNKTLKFVVTFTDNTTVTTYSTLRIFGEALSGNQFRGPGDCNTPTTFDIWSKLGFQGYDESIATLGKGDVTVYHSAVNNCDGIIRKPIIVIDGFDPGDGQKGYQLYNDYLNDGRKGKLGDSLRNRGYDIFILNFPTYEINGQIRDGGADYIERNARVLMALIDSVNAMKQGSEKLIIIGPSMGGLISRYALKYMEQNNMIHQAKLWISFDSPHQGANIPIGDQYWLDFYGEATKSVDIILNRDKKIGSIAAKQMLVAHYLNYGFPHSFRTTFTNTINTMGFPNGDSGQPFRKISLIDGSLGGNETNTAGEKAFTFDVRRWHDIDLWLFKVRYKTWTAAASKVYFTPSYGAINTVFDGWFLFKSRILGAATSSYTSGYDVAPGGTYNTQQQLAEKGDDQLIHALGANPNGGIRFKTKFYSVVPNHSFINTKGALAFSGTNQNLSEDISGRSLVCTGETPFDSYFGDLGQNREHVELWPSAISYILKEIDGFPQLPLIKTNLAIVGQSSFCSSSSYTIPNLPVGSTVTWSADKPAYVTLTASGTQNQTLAVSAAVYSATVVLTAEIKTSCSRMILTKTIYFGPPVGGYVTFSNGGAPANNPVTLQPCERNNSGTFYFTDNYGTTYNSYDNPGYEFEIVSTVNCDFYPDRYFDFAFDIPFNFTSGTATVGVKLKNACGWSDVYYVDLTVPPCSSGHRYAIYPNPASSEVTVALQEDKTSASRKAVVTKSKDFSVKLFDDKGRQVNREQKTKNSASVTVETSALPNGTYFLHISGDGQIIKKQIIVQH